MKRNIVLLLAFFALLSVGLPVLSAKLSWDPKVFMGVNEIKPGMIGYGKTVYHGTKIERFNIEVIGVLKKLDFGFDMILIRVTSGPVVTRKLQTVEGMSGSPIYINDRLIGAYAYGWDFEQEPIAGVTPIAAMLECTQPGTTGLSASAEGDLQPEASILKIDHHTISRVKIAASAGAAAREQAKADPGTMVLCPAATPLFVNGISDKALQPLQSLFSQYNLHAMPGPGKMTDSSAAPVKLEAGSAVAVSLMEGDANMSAVGTVTYVKGDTVLAFGHPFLGIGKVNLPMSTAYVQDILSSSQASFKLATPLEDVGTLISDRQFAVSGIVGQKPQTFAVSLHLTDDTRKFDRHYHVNIMNQAPFTPLILYLFALTGGASQLADMTSAEGTFTAHVNLSTKTQGDIEQTIAVSPQAAVNSLPPMAEVYLLASSLMENPYEPVPLISAAIEINYAPQRNIATIESISPDRPVVRPGETVNLAVRIRPYGKPVETRIVSVQAPLYGTQPAMIVIIAGGLHGMMMKSLLTPPPSPIEGVRGIIRWLTDSPSAKSMISAQVFAIPSYTYRGHLLKELPEPLAAVLNFGDIGGSPQAGIPGVSSSGGGGAGFSAIASSGGNASSSNGDETSMLPTVYESLQDVPYLLQGGQMVLIGIADPAIPKNGPMAQQLGSLFPILSNNISSPDQPSSGNQPSTTDAPPPQDALAFPWFTTPQHLRLSGLVSALGYPALRTTRPFSLPNIRFSGWHSALPLSSQLSMGSFPASFALGTPPDTSKAPNPEAGSGLTTSKPDGHKPPDHADDGSATTPPPTPDDGDGDNAAKSPTSVLLTRAHPAWGIMTAADFLRGTHIGTTVTSNSTLVLMPQIRSIFKTAEMLPWKMTSTKNGVYVAGWNTNKVLQIGDGTAKVDTPTLTFPKNATDAGQAESISALASDADGNLLIGTWPDHTVRLVSSDGAVRHIWSLPVNHIWDLLVTHGGKRYVACDQGSVYLLRDDPNAPYQLACTVADKAVYALTASADDTLYLASYPWGKVYRLSPTGVLSAVYQGKTSITSLAIDALGYLYMGSGQNSQVLRLSPEGTVTPLMTGAGNNCVMALQLAGTDLYVSTGPSGGIYRISAAATTPPEVTTIFAREDLRTGDNEIAATGLESVMVNALAVTPTGTVLAASSSPGQVLAIEPRKHGAFISAVLPAPAVSNWGNLEIGGTIGDGAVGVQTRSGKTSSPDATWSEWAPLRQGLRPLSPAATNAQIRIDFTDNATGHTTLDYVKLNYLPANRAPQVRVTSPAGGEVWNGTKKLVWQGRDPDGDQVIYSILASSDNGLKWGAIQFRAKPITTTTTPGTTPPAMTPPAVTPPVGTPPVIAPPVVTPPVVTPPDITPTIPRETAGGAASPPDFDLAKRDDIAASDAPHAAPRDPDAKDAPSAPVDSEKKSDTEPKPDEGLPIEETTMTSFSWDTTKVPDGIYILKVLATDKYAHPLDAKYSFFGTKQFVIDNTPPTISLPDHVAGADALRQFTITDAMTPIMGGKFRIDEGPWIALSAVNGIFDSKTEQVALITAAGAISLPAGKHSVEIIAVDQAGNKADRTVTVGEDKAATIPAPPPTPTIVPADAK